MSEAPFFKESSMKRLSTILVFSLIGISAMAVGCRMCDTCYPLGGLLGRENQECGCEKCQVVPRVGSIIDTPREAKDSDSPVDPSTLSPVQGAADTAASANGS